MWRFPIVLQTLTSETPKNIFLIESILVPFSAQLEGAGSQMFCSSLIENLSYARAAREEDVVEFLLQKLLGLLRATSYDTHKILMKQII